MYRYETHLHTSPVSKCARATVEETVEFYKSIGYDGIFITNHFIDGNINLEKQASYEERIEFYFSDYENAVKIGQNIGLKVFCGVEMSYKGTDFLVYGLGKSWYLAHPQIEQMKKSEELAFLMENGALVIQAHPFREAAYIDHIRLFPRSVHGVEVINANRDDFTNAMAEHYAESYGLLKTAGSDNHSGKGQLHLAGMASKEPLSDEHDFLRRVMSGKMELFTLDLNR